MLTSLDWSVAVLSRLLCREGRRLELLSAEDGLLLFIVVLRAICADDGRPSGEFPAVRRNFSGDVGLLFDLRPVRTAEARVLKPDTSPG